MKYTTLLLIVLALGGCIGDDIIFDTVPAALRITNPVDSLTVGETHQFETRYTNNIGVAEEQPVFWSSSDEEILSVNDDGLATALKEGVAELTAEVVVDGQESVMAALQVTVSMEEVIDDPSEMRGGTIRTTSSYLLEGSFEVREDGDGIIIDIGEDYRASTALPGLYLYLTNNPSTVNNALEIGAVEVFEGKHSYRVSGVGLFDYDYLLYWCKPFSVKVGDGEIE